MVAICLPIQAWVDAEALLRRDRRIRQLSWSEYHWIEHNGIYNRAVVNVVPANIEKIRGAFPNWTGYASAVFV